MRNFLIVLIAVPAGLATQAQAAALPLFDAFKTFCVDTGAKPDAIKKAVEGAGGRRHASGATTSPWPMTVESWDLFLSGHKMLISTGTLRAPNRRGPSTDSTDCIINSFSNEDGSIEEIRKWSGAPAQHVSPGAPELYSYQEQDLIRTPLTEDTAAYRAAEAAGRVWSLMTMHSQRSASVQLSHILASTLPR